MKVEVSTLAKLYPLDTLQDAHLNLLAAEGEVRDFSRGDFIFREGENDGETLFLLTGRIAGRSTDGRERDIDSDRNRYAIGDLQPRRFDAEVISARARVVAFNRDFLEKVVTWDQISRSSQFTLPDGTAECARWVFRMLQSKALQRLPAGNIERMFERFHAVPAMPGEEVVREGDPGDYFYVIKQGEFQVIKSDGDHEAVVALLKQGDSFGEDALISNEPRNATVKARTAGSLMRLARSDFGELVRHPVVEWITPGQAAALKELDGEIIDVRMKEEHRRRAIEGSINHPLFRLREEMVGKSKDKPYVVYCETGERSASAAFILSKLGFKAYALLGGVASVVRQMAHRQKSARSSKTTNA